MTLPLGLRVTAAAVSSLLALVVSTTAHAADRDAPSAAGTAWSERPLALHGVFSLPAGPTGLAGVELDYAPTARIGLTAGVGAGYLLTGGGWTPRYAFGARYRIPFAKAFAFGAGATFSTGKYKAKDFHPDDQDWQDDVIELDHALWAGAQLSLEWRFKGVSLKLLSGFEVLVNQGGASCYRTAYQGMGPNEPLSCAKVRPLESKSVFLAPLGTAIGYSF